MDQVAQVNIQALIDDFGYQDFVLVKAPRDKTLAAIRDILARRASGEDPAAGSAFMALPKVITRVFSRRLRPEEQVKVPVEPAEPEIELPPQPPLALHFDEAAAAPGTMITWERGPLSDPRTALEPPSRYHDDIRVSSPKAAPEYTLVEFREDISGMCLLARDLSTRLHDRDVLYFRRSGDIAHDIHFDFHVYREGATLRRVLCHSTWPLGEETKEWWEGITDGELTRYETAHLYSGVADMDLLDSEKQESILAYLGLSYDMLFKPNATKDAVLISRRPGGEPLDPMA